jgi:hypothetical protein
MPEYIRQSPAHGQVLLLVFVFFTLLLSSCGGDIRVTPQYLAGVWLEDQSGASVVFHTNQAIRFHANGFFENGDWDAQARVFHPWPHFGSSPGFTNTFEIAAEGWSFPTVTGRPCIPGGRLLLGLDGAEETLGVRAESADRLVLIGESPRRYLRVK